MPRMRAIRIVYWSFLVSLLGLLLSSGCTVKNKGTPHANQPPKVFFSSIPVSGTIFTKPDQFFWFALDRDGYIVEFQYALIPDSIIGFSKVPEPQRDSVVYDFLKRNRPDATGEWKAFRVADPLRLDTLRYPWVSVDNISQNGQTDTIALPTSSRTASDTTTRLTLVFVRARDDRGTLTTDSPNYPDSNSIAWRNFGRKNRPPRTHFVNIGTCNRAAITAVGSPPTFYSLDVNTYDPSPFMRVGHCGITINWIGSDSLDYPSQPQPRFDYFWELFGPFSSAASSGAGDSTKLWASTTYPNRWPGPNALPYQSPNRRTFTPATSMTFFGLRGFDTLTNFRPGFYHFRVRARDDADVLATQAASVTFRIFHPRFDRDILLIGKSTDNGSPVIFIPPTTFLSEASPLPAESTAVQNYYLKLIRDAGYVFPRFDSAQDVTFFSGKTPIPESLLARYKLVIFHKWRSYFTGSGETNFLVSLKNYMDAGGSVWGMGRDDLSDIVTIFNQPQPTEIPFDQSFMPGTGPGSGPLNGVGYFYFGVEKMFYSAHNLSVARDSVSREEFVGADPSDVAVSEGFPSLDIDTNVLMGFTVVSPPRKDSSRYRRYPAVNYFVRAPRSEHLYLFRSPVGIADTSHLHGKVAALRSDRHYFKSAYFGFPLHGIEEAEAVEVMRKMLNWFIGPP